MTTHTDHTRVAHSSSTGTLPVMRKEAVGRIPSAPISASEGESLCCDAKTTHPPSPATDLYTKALGWPVVANGMSILLRCGEVADVMLMPSGLGGEVNHSLKLLELDVAVLEVIGSSSRWAFFCKSQPASITHLGILSLRGVIHHGDGSHFTLPPSPACRSDTVRWICPPTPGVTVLPPLGTVLACAQTALRR